jgi:hypothetical protein
LEVAILREFDGPFHWHTFFSVFLVVLVNYTVV